MKAYKETANHYYKYVWGYFDDFVQTPLSGNGNLGGDSWAVTGWGGNYAGSPYLAVKPQTGTYSAYSKGGQPGVTINMYTPKPTIITSFTYSATWDSGGAYITLLGSNDNSTWTTLSPQTWRALGSQTVSIENSTPFQYYLLDVLTTGGGYHDGINVYNVQLIGKEYSRQAQEVTAEDEYDFIVEDYKYYLPKTTERKYYKYVTEAFSSGNAGSVTGYHWHTRDGWYGAYYTCTNPTVLKSVNITIGWTDTASFQQGLVCNLQAQGSNDNSTWTTIKNWGDRSGRGTSHVLDCSENTTEYKYFRFYAENGGWEGNDSCDVASVEYVGTDTVVQEVTAEDEYDFIVEDDEYYAVKSYAKGQYYGN